MKTSPLKTDRTSFSQQTVALILPRLDDMANLINAARSGSLPRTDSTNVPAQGKEIYVERRFDREMSDCVLAARDKLKSIGSSRKVSLNSFEIAALAAALRDRLNDVRASGEMLTLQEAENLARRVENHRKCAKRAAVGQIGEIAYEEMAVRWTHFLEWLRYHLRFERPSRQEKQAVPSRHREEVAKSSRRDEINAVKALLMQVVRAETDPRMVERLAELVREAVRRGDYLFEFATVPMLLEDPEKARDFLADCLGRRKGFRGEILRPQYQDLSSRMSANSVKLERGKVIGAD